MTEHTDKAIQHTVKMWIQTQLHKQMLKDVAIHDSTWFETSEDEHKAFCELEEKYNHLFDLTEKRDSPT